eukprot:Plantae.Rhodophyta-Hildenbrandia_rubra.ctg16412.p1 GENE.Plantae.Rhodophyta-Hildenbrandia_rubra.ctg16412~~Plantae.Rhodophyta-Hildenbrandia_rubra.ctg16412.p1  ORF type:complete len:423 (+),score=51.30 Plantae.Rhodophyta-Hildenbrandia_rubra.ctg16412:434-1702(+)
MGSFHTIFIATLLILSTSALADSDPDSIDGLNPSAPPVIPPPGRCFFPEDCKSGEYCQETPSGFTLFRLGTCKPRLSAGTNCAGMSIGACDEESYCETTPPPDATSDAITCKAKGENGDKCDSNFGNDACLKELVCRVEVDGKKDACGVAGAEGDQCRFEGCSEGLYCDTGSDFVGVCKKKVEIGGSCSSFKCCVDEAFQPSGSVCENRLAEGAECVGKGGDDACQEGLKCNGDELINGNPESVPRCVKESELLRKGGALCNIKNDKCDDSRFLVCRKREDKSVCVFEIPAGPCNPGAEFEVCLPNPGETKCLEIIDGGKPTGEFACQEDGGIEPTKAPSPDPTPTPSSKPKNPRCSKNRDCKRHEECRRGKCIKRSRCNRWRRSLCKRRCQWCDRRSGKCRGGCRRRHFCRRGRCIRSRHY